MIRVAGSVSKSWLARQLPVAFDRSYYFDIERRHAIDVRCNEYVAESLGDLNVFYTESNLGRREWYAPNQLLIGGIQPNMIVGLLLGAQFLPQDNADADISAKCLAERDASDLPDPESLLEHPLVRQWSDEISAMLDHPDQQQPIPPFFWDRSGRAAVHGLVTSGLKFCGDDFMMNLLVDPDRCDSIIQWLTDATVVLVGHFSGVGRLPVASIHVGECAACMLDVASFRQFVVPATSRLGDRFGNLRFHSCGCSNHLLEACRDIVGLTELDVGGETSVAKIRALFGSEFPVGIAPTVEDMRSESELPILAWFQHVERENAGGNLTIGFHLEADYRIENLRALVTAIRP